MEDDKKPDPTNETDDEEAAESESSGNQKPGTGGPDRAGDVIIIK